MITFDQIIKDINNKIYRPVYFLQGEEPYFIDQISDLLESSVLEEAERSFNQTVVYGRDVDTSSIVNLAKGFPMMSNFQVVIVKEAQDIRNLIPTKAKSKKEQEQNLLEKYLHNPLQSTILVFCYKYKTLDARTTLSKLFDQKGILFESKKLQDNKIAGWIHNYVKERAYSMTPEAALLLAEYLGNDLSKIANEVQKLFIGLPKGSEIDKNLIEQNIGISKDYNVFELQKALVGCDLLKINRIINYYGSNIKENPIQMVIPTLFRFFIKILIYHRLQDKSRNNAASILGVNPYFIDDYVRAAATFSQAKLIRNISVLRDFDMRAKGYGANVNNMKPADIYKEMIFRLIE